MLDERMWIPLNRHIISLVRIMSKGTHFVTSLFSSQPFIYSATWNLTYHLPISEVWLKAKFLLINDGGMILIQPWCWPRNMLQRESLFGRLNYKLSSMYVANLQGFCILGHVSYLTEALRCCIFSLTFRRRLCSCSSLDEALKADGSWVGRRGSDAVKQRAVRVITVCGWVGNGARRPQRQG